MAPSMAPTVPAPLPTSPLPITARMPAQAKARAEAEPVHPRRNGCLQLREAGFDPAFDFDVAFDLCIRLRGHVGWGLQA
ncbi:hypothetical protein, partial [Stenotrophomonas maltophilia]|uniref:hypothetical protein n=1 Tax=Stenotrophomonas maltophilia TaxID=40324 RepID=UPI0019559FB0